MAITPLLSAFLANDLATASFLTKHGANIKARDPIKKRTILHLAVKKNMSDLVPLLLQQGLNANDEDVDGWTPLFYAVVNACASETTLVDMLLEAGASILLIFLSKVQD